MLSIGEFAQLGMLTLLYHDYTPTDPDAGITELQLPIVR
jgi:hypothetical protein